MCAHSLCVVTWGPLGFGVDRSLPKSVWATPSALRGLTKHSSAGPGAHFFTSIGSSCAVRTAYSPRLPATLTGASSGVAHDEYTFPVMERSLRFLRDAMYLLPGCTPLT